MQAREEQLRASERAKVRSEGFSKTPKPLNLFEVETHPTGEV